jgi:hypothetical protein
VIDVTKSSVQLWLYGGSMISAIIFGILLASLWQPHESEISMGGSSVIGIVLETRGTGYIQYQSTGPTFSSFDHGCVDDYVIGFHCLYLHNNGAPGVVQVKIPNYVVKDFGGIISVDVGLLNRIPFETISHDSEQTTLRFVVPEGHDTITVNAAYGISPQLLYLLTAFMFTCIMFAVSFFFICGLYYGIEKIKYRIKEKPI